MERKNKSKAPSPGQPLSGQGVLKIPRFNIIKNQLRIATWNVRSLYAAGKLDNMIQEARRLKMNILGISELRWPGSGLCRHEHGTLYYSGRDPQDRNHWNGVGVFVSANYVRYVKNFIPISDRIMLLQMQSQPFNVSIIQVYAPTADTKHDNDVE